MEHNMPWIESPFFEKELAECNLSESEKILVRSFANNGYIIIDPEIDLDVINRARKATEKLITDNPSLHNRVGHAWRFNDDVKRIALAPKVLNLLELLYRRKPIPFQTLNFKEGTQQRTHSDMIHFSSLPERFMCGVWLAFEDVHEGNGPLHYYAGSHKLPFYNMLDIGIKASQSKKMTNTHMDYSNFYENFIENVIKAKKLQKVTLNIQKGQALIWAANLLHGGEKILEKGTTRNSQVTHYYFENCMYYTPLFTDFGLKKIDMPILTNITTGKIIENKYLGEPVSVISASKILNRLPLTPIFRLYAKYKNAKLSKK